MEYVPHVGRTFAVCPHLVEAGTRMTSARTYFFDVPRQVKNHRTGEVCNVYGHAACPACVKASGDDWNKIPIAALTTLGGKVDLN